MITALIVAAGEGTRMREKVPKPYIKLKGVPILGVTLSRFNPHPKVDSIVIVTHSKWVEYCKLEIVDKFGFNKVESVIQGGPRRQDSVRLGLAVVNSEFILIHDAVRPFITAEFVSKLIREVKQCDAVIPGVPVTDTIKEIRDGFVHYTLDRDRLYEIQTPQVFRVNVIKKAHEEALKANFYSTDDSALVEGLGIKVKLVDGLTQNIKITTKQDLLHAEALLKNYNT